MTQLVSYIALAAPATRRPATGKEPFLRPEIGFTPKWFRQNLDVDFGERWHRDPAYRRQSIVAMGHEVRKRFGNLEIGAVVDPDEPADLLTGVFGTSFVAAIYGVPIDYQEENWPWSTHKYLTDDEVSRLEPPDLDANPFFCEFMEQVEWIAREHGMIEGYVNWQGILNNAYRMRGEDVFLDLITEPERARHLFECVTTTMIDGARRLYERQRQSGVKRSHFTVSNCLVNMVSPEQYHDLLLPCDRRLAQEFGTIGVHNCSWNANPYLEHYATLPNLGYVDMGMESDLPLARDLFPNARRAIMYTPMDVAGKSSAEIRQDLERIAHEYGPCDLVFADIEAGTPDERVFALARFCEEISAAALAR